MQVHVHPHVLTPPVWTMTEPLPEWPTSCFPGVIAASICGSHALGYEPAVHPGSAAHHSCDATTSGDMIENGPVDRGMSIILTGVTSE